MIDAFDADRKLVKVPLALTRSLLQASSTTLREAPRVTERRGLVDHALVFLYATVLLHMRRPDSFRRRIRLKRCTFHCGKCTLPSHFAMFKTCLCTVCLCFHEANLTCLAARCIPTRIRRREFSVSKKCCGGSPATPCFSHYLTHGHLQ